MKQFRLLLLLGALMALTMQAWAQSATTHVVDQTTVETIFSGDGYTLGDAVAAGDVLDFQGEIDLGEETSHSLVVNKRVSIISSTQDAVVKLHTVAGSLLGEAPGNSFVINKAASGSTLQDIQLFNTEAWFYNTSNVTFTGVTFHVENARVGSGVGHVSVRFSNNITFDGCTIYTKDNYGTSCCVVSASNNCTFKNCSFEGEGNIGNLLYLGNVFNLDDKPTDFGDNDQSTDCSVLNCSFTRSGTSAAAFLLGGLRHRVEGVTSENLNISYAFGAATPTSAEDGHIYRNNTYKGSMTVLKYSTAENNTLSGGTFSVQQGATATGNTVKGNMTVNQDATATSNTITGNVTISQNATVQGNTVIGNVTASGVGATVKDNDITGNVSLTRNDITVTGNTVQGKLTHSQKTATITGNAITSTEEYAVYLNSTAADANNIVQYNNLKAAEKTGDAAVSSKSEGNTVSDNYVAYKVKMKEGVQDADKWTITPNEGLKEGDAVTLKYNGRLKVKGVTATSDAAPAPASLIVNPAVGQVIGADGKNYADAAAATAANTTVVAVIAYVGSSTGDDDYTNGLAIALADEAQSNWSTAKSTCEGKTAITGAKWCLPSQDQWKQMFKANGGNEGSYTGLNTTITTAGGTILQEFASYWSSSERSPGADAYDVDLSYGYADWYSDDEGSGFRVRACLAF